MAASTDPAGGWLRPAPFDGSAASMAAHAAAIGTVMAGEGRLWLGVGDPPARLPAGAEDTVLVVPTSGSTGAARSVLHPLRTLLTSQDATAALFAAEGIGGGGHGFWLPLLPPTHIAGVQVLARAHRTAAVHGLPGPALPAELPALEAHFDAARFVALAEPALAEAEAAGLPAFTSLVPTQLGRLLGGASGDHARARALLRRFAAILVGGAATPREALAAARAGRLPVRTTYGSSETAGGCVYDGVPLEGVRLSLAAPAQGHGEGEAPAAEALREGRLLLDAPTLATGLLTAQGTLDESAFTIVRGRRVLVTSDLARLDAQGRLTVLGRADDVIVTGGVKVLPQDVERAVEASLVLRELVTGCIVVGVPDADWGQRVEALVTLGPAAREEEATALLRSALRITDLPAAALPRRVHVVDALPLRGIGKPDRAAARAFAAAR